MLPHQVRRQDPHADLVRLQLPRPRLGAGARLHQHLLTRLQLLKKTAERLTRLAVILVDHLPAAVFTGDAKVVLRQIDSHDPNLRSNLFHGLAPSQLRW